jgi:hypothetical protein
VGFNAAGRHNEELAGNGGIQPEETTFVSKRQGYW